MSAATNAVASSSTAPQAPSPDVQMSDSGTANEAAKKTRRRELGLDASLILSEGRSKRRRTPTPPPKVEKEVERDEGPKDRVRASKLGLEIYRRVLVETDKDGAVMSKPFVKLPPERQYADYYQVIKSPMSLEIVHRKLEAQEYETLEAVRNDFSLIFNNAKRYNTNESLLFQYAKKLHKLTRTMYEELSIATHPPSSQRGETAAEESDSDREGEPVSTYNERTPGAGEDDGDEGDDKLAANSSPGNLDHKGRGRKRGNYFKNGPTVYKLIKPALKALQQAHSKTRLGRQLSEMFRHLPNREEFPDYYQVIASPISLEQIERRLKDRQYQNYNEFFTEVERMCDNAMYYNEEGSEVHQDAVEIKGRLSSLKAEIEQRVSNPQTTKTIRIKVPSVQPTAVPYTATPATAVASALPATPAAPRPAQQPPPPVSGLPRGVVNAELVAKMKSFSQAEQVAWVTSLKGEQQATLQQLMIPPRTAPAQAPPSRPVVDTPAVARTISAPDRSKPAIEHLIFGFRLKPESKKLSTLLQNWDGLAHHAVTVGEETDSVEITAFAAKPADAAATDSPTKGGQSLSAKANGTAIASSIGDDGSQSWSVVFEPQVASMTIELTGGSGIPSSIFISRQI